jgi:adenylate cyclase
VEPVTSVDTPRRSDLSDRDRTRILLDVMRALSSELDLDSLLSLIMAETARALEAERASLFLRDPDTGELVFRVTQDAELRETRIPPGVGIAGSVALTGELVNISDAYADPRFNQEVDRQSGFRTRTILCVPLPGEGGTVAGALQALNKEGGVFTTQDEEMLQAVASQSAIAIRNAKLYADVVQMKNYNESILRSMAAGVLSIDGQGRITTANPAVGRILAPDRPYLIGSAFAEVVDREQNPEFWELAHDGFRDGVARRLEGLHLLSRTRPAASINATVVPLHDHQEQQVGAVLVVEDVSRERRDAERGGAAPPRRRAHGRHPRLHHPRRIHPPGRDGGDAQRLLRPHDRCRLSL